MAGARDLSACPSPSLAPPCTNQALTAELLARKGQVHTLRSQVADLQKTLAQKDSQVRSVTLNTHFEDTLMIKDTLQEHLRSTCNLQRTLAEKDVHVREHTLKDTH